MKRFLISLIACVCVSIGAWAEVTLSDANPYMVLTTSSVGDISNGFDNISWFGYSNERIGLKIIGPLNQADIDKLASFNTTLSTEDALLDLSGATLSDGVTVSSVSSKFTILRVPISYDLENNSLPSSISFAFSTNASRQRYWGADTEENGIITLSVNEGGLTKARTILNNSESYGYNNYLRWREVTLMGTYTAAEYETFTSEFTSGEKDNPVVTVVTNSPLSVFGCNVTLDLSKAEAGQTLADLIALAKAKVIEGGGTGICTLTVKGELTANDLIALGGTNMTGATRIDLSGATLASGVSIDDLQIPSSLTSLVLPKNTTVTVGLKTKMTNWTNLSYAYSPSTGVTETVGEEEHPVVADYVWVNKAGGMAAALTAETSLTTSKYIKVASNVALNASDIDFSSTTGLKYLDLRYANFTSTISSNFKSSAATGYRIILPDDWTAAEMATFGDTTLGSVAWAMAGIYSYSGTTLRIHELTDGEYMTTALNNSRIVYSGTTAIEIVGSRLGENLLAALNAAASSVKTITVTASSLNDLTFTNPNITTLNVTGLTLNTSPGSITVDDDCTSLTTLNVTDCSLMTVVATDVSSLKTVNLNGTTISGVTNLSNTGLTTFTTNSSTKLQGDINLMSTALTSLNTTAEIGTTTGGTGNILLNGCESLASITLGSAQFKNGTSMIHIDKNTTENNDAIDAIDALSRTETVGESQVAVKTIFVPNGFTSSTRIHPYDEVKNNVSEVAGSSANEDGDKCSITYDATTKVATVHTNEPGHFATMMETRYGNYPLGTTFKFDSESVINEADLKALAGTINANDYSWRSNYYYVDLYDLTATDALCNNTTGVIGKTISWLRTNDRQFKGLILPKDHTLYGSGISLIQSENANTAGELSTCSEFIAYYKTKEIKEGESEPTNLTKKILFTHVYNQTATNSEGIQASNDKLTELLTAHGLNGAGDNAADLYSVSTNGTTPFDATALVGSKGYIETFNNEMVGEPTKANIYAYPKAAGEYTTFVGSSSIGVTPTETLKIAGTVSDDASAVATAFNTFANGPRVLDLSEIDPNDDTFLKGVLEKLTNDDIEYIILPEGKSKELVCKTTYSTKLTKLKAVISSSNTNLVAYVKQAGSLAEARYLATGGSVDANTGMITPAQTGLQSVTLTGNLNAADIAANTTTKKVDKSGNWGSGSGNASSIALSSEQGTITTIDLKDAVFEVQDDMNFSYAGLSSLKNVTLPTSKSMTLICDECFMGIASLSEICVPYNYTKFGDAAFHNSSLDHLTTTDANGALIDNGPKTFTFSKNVEEIGNKPATADANGVYSLSRNVFAHNTGVTDVYVLAHKVPKCYAHSFPANMLYGWGGFKGGDYPYCREKYDNSSDGSMIFTVLHFPDEASFNASTDKEESYAIMKRLYTDVNKVYTKKEQTGAVDANGDPIAWPTFAELRRAYNQATAGAQWYDWNIKYDDQYSINGGNYIPVGSGEYTVVPNGTDPNVGKDYSFADYEGWHQFTLSLATYVESDKTVVNDVVKNYYVEGPWYTLCIPFNLTLDQAREILGVPASEEGVEENYLGETLITSSNKKLPDVRTLQSVIRKPGTTNEVTLKFTKDLIKDGECCFWNINDGAPNQSGYASTGATTDGDVIAIRGGYPYLVKPYLPQEVVVKNLGKYIMTKYGNEFKQELSCINLDYCYQDLGEYSTANKTGRFAKPYEQHKIQAYLDTNDGTKGYTTHANGKKYYYTFIGQFWTQPLPQYAFYMVETNEATTQNSTKPKWYRYASGNKNYKWNQYKCIILPTQEVEDAAPDGRSYLYTNSGLYRNNAEGKSVYPTSSGTDAQGGYKFDGQLYIEFLNGLDDAIFDETASARYVIEFDDAGVQEIVDDDSAVTAISNLDGEDILPTGKSLKVYNVAGQYVGQSLDGLAKGMYIVNGKKVLVK